MPTELQEHQKRVLKKLENEDAVLVYHGMGSGKSLTALAAGEKFKKPLEVVGPASLKFNFQKEKSKHGIGTKVKTYSYNKPPVIANKDAILVFDEAHRMGRMESQRSHLPDELKGHKTMFLTGTPIRNSPDELIPIMRGLGIKAKRDPKDFEERFVGTRKEYPGLWARIWHGAKPGEVRVAKDMDKFKDMFKGKVDYYKPSEKGYPSKVERDIVVEMSPEQEEAYTMAMKQDPSLYYKIRKGISPSKSESKRMNAFLTATRQISNYPGGYNLAAKDEDAPKITKAFQEIQHRYKSDPRYKGVTYSNYLAHGIDPLEKHLQASGIPYKRFTGQTKPSEKPEIIKAYNEGKIKHLLISGAGGEGLDLKGTKLMQLLEPHWNDPQLEQVKGRAIRLGSHAHLPKKERQVEIQNYVAIPREHGLIFKSRDRGTDEYLKMLSKQKTDLNEQFLQALREVGSE